MTIRKKRVQLCNTCYVCNKHYSKPYTLKRHITGVHGIQLTNQRNSMKRGISAKYEFVGDRLGDVIHHACSACIYHTPNLSKLVKHMEDLHTPVRTLETVPEENDERRKKVRIVDQTSKERVDNRPKKDDTEELMIFIVKRIDSLAFK